jgi:hypothetical protein
VRNTEERDKIRMYIKNNPFKWKHDMDNEEGIFM